MSTAFPVCPICRSTHWRVVYDGPVRDGGHGRSIPAQVAACEGCGVERLAESACLKDEAYRGEAYRAHLGQDHDPAKHYATHDELALFTLDTLWPLNLRGKTIADVGCGGGSLLDHLKGLPATALAIDPDTGWKASLEARGYRWFGGAEAAAATLGATVDVAFSIQVIEHVLDPVEFLAGIGKMLAPDGLLLLSTPNRADILMDLLPVEFPPFFYRSQHRWYFTAETLTACCKAAGLVVEEVRHVHRYGMANALLWLRDKRPQGRAGLPGIDRQADLLWKAQLETTGKADNLYLKVRRA